MNSKTQTHRRHRPHIHPGRAFGVTAINRVADRIDLAIDLLTLGQYGLECREVPPGPRTGEWLRGEQGSDPPNGSRTAWEAPRTSRRPGCEWPWPQRPAPSQGIGRSRA